MNSSQLLPVAAVINELLATYLTMIWNCLYRHFEEFLMKIQVFGSLFKTSKLVVEMNFYHVCHKCMESCFLKECILINQVLFSVWISKASCWNEFHYDRVSLFLKEFLMRMSFLKSHSSSLIKVSNLFSWNEQMKILSHISQWCGSLVF